MTEDIPRPAPLPKLLDDGNRALRAALDLPDKFCRSKHRQAIGEIALEHPHTVCFVTLLEEGTCVSQAFGLTNEPDYRKVALRPPGNVFAGKKFVMWLLQGRLLEIDQPISGALVLYFAGEDWRHVGVISAPGRVTSQWGTYPVYDHKTSEVPARYGDRVRFFKMLAPREALTQFLNFAHDHGGSA